MLFMDFIEPKSSPSGTLYNFHRSSYCQSSCYDKYIDIHSVTFHSFIVYTRENNDKKYN